VEILVLDWFKEFMGYPRGAQGVITGGGSEANLLALVTAREALDGRRGTSEAACPYEGARQAPGEPGGVSPGSPNQLRRARAYVCAQRHWSIDRAFKVMGLDPEQVRPIAVDERGRMRVDALAQAARRDRDNGWVPWLAVANAGATNTGAVDPLGPIAACCRAEKLWLHVDAAYGWPAALTAEGKALLAGIEEADSLTLDPHKWFAQPFGAGCVLVRDGKLLPRTFQMRPEYMQDVEPGDDEINFADHGIALTRRFRALKIWLSIKVLGIGWFRRLVAHCCNLARYSAALLAQRGFEIVTPPSLSIVCFRRVPPGAALSPAAVNDFNLALCERLRETGRAFLSTTRLDDKVCLRFCFVNYRTCPEDVEEIVALLEELAGEEAEH
jgi:glutamate/tyrosine decarboxylase-like PLP-dependent enzyme